MIHTDDQSAELLDFLLGLLVLTADLISQELDRFAQVAQLGPQRTRCTEVAVLQPRDLIGDIGIDASLDR